MTRRLLTRRSPWDAFHPTGEPVLGGSRTLRRRERSGDAAASYPSRFERPTLVAWWVALLCLPLSPTGAQSTAGPVAAPELRPIWARLGDANGHAGAVEVAVFSPDGRYVATGAKYDNQVMLWRAVDGTLVWSRPVDQETEAIAFSPDGRFLASGGEDDEVRVWRVADGGMVKVLPHGASLDGLAWSHDGRLLVTGEERAASGEGKVRFWAMPEGRLLGVVDQGHTTNSVAFTRDDRYVVTAGGNGEARLWRVADRTLVRTFRGPEGGGSIKSVRLSPDDSLIAAGNSRGVIALWDVATAQVLRTVVYPDAVEAVEFGPDGTHLLAGGSGPNPIWILNVPDLSLARTVPQTETEYLHFSANGAQLATAHEDGTVRVWLWHSGDPGLNGRMHRALAERQRQAAKERAPSGRSPEPQPRRPNDP